MEGQFLITNVRHTREGYTRLMLAKSSSSDIHMSFELSSYCYVGTSAINYDNSISVYPKALISYSTNVRGYYMVEYVGNMSLNLPPSLLSADAAESLLRKVITIRRWSLYDVLSDIISCCEQCQRDLRLNWLDHDRAR